MENLLEDRMRFSFTIKIIDDLIIITTPCESNISEGNLIAAKFAGLLKKSIIFNTCAVTHKHTELILKYMERLKKILPDYKIYITGCGSTFYPEKYKGIGIIIPEKDKFKPESYGINSENIELVNTFTPVVKVQDGCSHHCTYCITRIVKGKSVSKSYQEIYNTIKKITDIGWKDIVLSGINLTEYYYDGMYLSELCKKILSDFPEINLKTTNMDPAAPETKKIIELIKNEPRMTKELHLPIQSGNNEILKLMKRRHTVEDIESLYELLKDSDIQTYWDIIVGFPGETEEQFNDTCKLIKKYKPNYSLVLPCCLHRGTEAYTLPNRVSAEEAFRRTEIARKLVDENKKENTEEAIFDINDNTIRHVLILLSYREYIISRKKVSIDISNLCNVNNYMENYNDLKILLGELLYIGIIDRLYLIISDDTDIEYLHALKDWLKKVGQLEKVEIIGK